MILLKDWWSEMRPGFAGSAPLHDAADRNSFAASARAIARMFIIRAASGVVGDPEPWLEAPVESYVTRLIPSGDPEYKALLDCHAAAQQQNISALTVALQRAAAICFQDSAHHAARAFARLAYSAALEVGSWEDARRAAAFLHRLAVLDENPPAAERWEMRADLHWRRVQSATPHV